MITSRSALKFDLFAEASRQHKRDEIRFRLLPGTSTSPSWRSWWMP